MHHAYSADYLQIGNLRQVRQDFVLHAVSEIGVRFFFTKIFKRQHSDALFGNC